MSDSTISRYMGSRILAKDVLVDSRNLPIDPNAYYDCEHIGSRVLQIQRAGLLFKLTKKKSRAKK